MLAFAIITVLFYLLVWVWLYFWGEEWLNREGKREEEEY